MNQPFFKSKRLIAAVLSVCLVVSDQSAVSYAQAAAGEYALNAQAAEQMLSAAQSVFPGFSLSSNLGSVTDVYQAPQNEKSRTIIYIQDAHDSLEAQEHIARMIKTFVRDSGIQTVFEEGYEGDVPTDDYFGSIQDPEIKEQVSYFLMDKLRIGGAEYAHINRCRSAAESCGKGDFKLIGADSTELHRANVEAYQKNSVYFARVQKDLQEIYERIERLANIRFPKELKRWMKIKKRYDTGQLDLLNYLKRTTALSGFLDYSLQAYPNLVVLLSLEATKDAKAIEKAKSINSVQLFQEIGELEDTAAERFLNSDRDRKIFSYYKALSLMLRLSSIEVTAEEYAAAKSMLEALDTRQMARFIAANSKHTVVVSSEWEDKINNAIRFYEIAHKRDYSIEKNLEDFLMSDEPAAVLVFGGFHKDKIQEIMRAKGISFITLQPVIQSISEKHREYYRQLMSSGYLDFEKSFALDRTQNFLETSAGAPQAARMSRTLLVWDVPGYRQIVTGLADTARVLKKRSPLMDRPVLLRQMAKGLQVYKLREDRSELRSQDSQPESSPAPKLKLRLDSRQDFAAPRIRKHLYELEKQKKRQAFIEKAKEYAILFASVALTAFMIILSVLDAGTQIYVRDLILPTAAAFGATIWVLYRFLYERDFRKSTEQERINFARILKATKNGADVIHALETIEAYAERPRLEKRAETAQAAAAIKNQILANNPLMAIVDQEKISKGDTVVIFEIPGTGHNGLGIKEMNALFGELLTDNFLAEVGKQLRQIMDQIARQRNIAVTPLYSTHKEHVFSLKNGIDENFLKAEIQTRLEDVMNKILLESEEFEYRRILDEKGIEKNGGHLFEIHFGMSRVAEDTGRARLTANMQAKQALLISRYSSVWGRNKDLGFSLYSDEKYSALVRELGGIRQRLLDNGTVALFEEGKNEDFGTYYYLKTNAANILRKKVQWNELSREQQALFSDPQIYRSAQQYFEILNLQDVIKKWQMNEDEAFKELDEIREIIKTIDFLFLPEEGAAPALAVEEMPLDLIARQKLASLTKYALHDARDRRAYTQDVFHAKASEMDNPVIVGLDVIGMGPMNYEAFDRELQQIDKFLKAGYSVSDAEIQVIQRQAADPVTLNRDRILDAVEDQLREVYRKFGLALPDELISRIGGDEVVFVADANVLRGAVLDRFLTGLRQRIREDIGIHVRVAADALIQDYRQRFAQMKRDDSPEMMAHARALSLLDTNVNYVLKPIEARGLTGERNGYAGAIVVRDKRAGFFKRWNRVIETDQGSVRIDAMTDLFLSRVNANSKLTVAPQRAEQRPAGNESGSYPQPVEFYEHPWSVENELPVVFTSLMRFPGQLTALDRSVFPALFKAQRGDSKQLKMSFLATNTGEEIAGYLYALSLAYDQHPEWGKAEELDLSIVANDLFTDLLDEAAKRLSGRSPFVYNESFIGEQQEERMTDYEPSLRPVPSSFEPFLQAMNSLKPLIQKSISFIPGSMFRSLQLYRAMAGSDMVVLNAAPLPSWKPFLWLFRKILTRGQRPPLIVTTRKELVQGLPGYQVIELRDLAWVKSFIAVPEWLQKDFDTGPINSLMPDRSELRMSPQNPEPDELRQRLLGSLESEPDAQSPLLQALFMFDALKQTVEGEPSAKNPVFSLTSDDILKSILENRKAVDVFDHPTTQENLKILEGLPYLYRLAVNGIATEPDHYGRLFIRTAQSRLAPEASMAKALEMGLKTVKTGTPQEIRDEKLLKVKRFLDYHFLRVFLRYWARDYAPHLPVMLTEGVTIDTIEKNQMLMANITHLSQTVLKAVYDINYEYLSALYGKPDSAGSIVLAGANARGEYPTFDYDAIVLYEHDGQTAGGEQAAISNKEFYQRLAVLVRESLEGDIKSGLPGMGREIDAKYQNTLFDSYLAKWDVDTRAPMWALSMRQAEEAFKGARPMGVLVSLMQLGYGAGNKKLAKRFISAAEEYLNREDHLLEAIAQIMIYADQDEKEKKERPADGEHAIDIKNDEGGLRNINYLLWFLRLYRRLLRLRAGQGVVIQKPLPGLNFLDTLTVLQREIKSSEVRHRIMAYYVYLINLRLTMDLFYARNSKQLPTDPLALAYFAFYNVSFISQTPDPLEFSGQSATQPLQEEFLAQLTDTMRQIHEMTQQIIGQILNGDLSPMRIEDRVLEAQPALLSQEILEAEKQALRDRSRRFAEQAEEERRQRLAARELERTGGLTEEQMFELVTSFLIVQRQVDPFLAGTRAESLANSSRRQFERIAMQEAARRKGELRSNAETLAGVRGEITRWNEGYAKNKKHFGLQIGQRLNMASGPGSVLEFDFLKRMMRLMLPEASVLKVSPRSDIDYVSSAEEFEQMLDLLQAAGILQEPQALRKGEDSERERLKHAYAVLVDNFDYYNRERVSELVGADAFGPIIAGYKSRMPEHYLQSERTFQTVISFVLQMYEQRFFGEIEAEPVRDLDEYFVLQKRKTLHFDWERGFYEGEAEVVALKSEEGPVNQFFAIHPELTFKPFEYGTPDAEILEALRLNRDAFNQWIHLHRLQQTVSPLDQQQFQTLVQSFVRLLGQSSGDDHAFSNKIWYLHRLGLLSAYIGEYEPGKIGNLIADAKVHEFTTDQHSLYHFEVLDKVRPDDPAAFALIRDFYLKIENSPEDSHERKLLAALRLSVLLHDSAKGFLFEGAADHAIQAAQNAVPRYLKEMGFDGETIETTAWVVRNHMVLNSYAYRRLVQHPEEISDAVERIAWDPGITPERLNLLYLISLSDYFSRVPLAKYPKEDPHFELGLRALPDPAPGREWTSLERMHQLYQASLAIVTAPDANTKEEMMRKVRAQRDAEIQSFWDRFFSETKSRVLESLDKEVLYEQHLAAAQAGKATVDEESIRRNSDQTVDNLYANYFAEILDEEAKTPEIQAEVQKRALLDFNNLFIRQYVQAFDPGYLKGLDFEEHIQRYLFIVHLAVLRDQGYRKPIVLFSRGFDNVSERHHEFIVGMTTDERGTFEDVTGILSLHDFDVQGARFLRTDAGLIVDRVFGFRRNGDAEIETLRERIWRDLGRVFSDYSRQDHAVEILYREARKDYYSVRPPSPLTKGTRIQWFDDRNEDGVDASVFTVKTIDRPLLLHVIGRILNTQGYSVVKAPITTYEPFTDNTFYISKDDKVLSDEEKAALGDLFVSILDQARIKIAGIKPASSYASDTADIDSASGHAELRADDDGNVGGDFWLFFAVAGVFAAAELIYLFQPKMEHQPRESQRTKVEKSEPSAYQQWGDQLLRRMANVSLDEEERFYAAGQLSLLLSGQAALGVDTGSGAEPPISPAEKRYIAGQFAEWLFYMSERYDNALGHEDALQRSNESYFAYRFIEALAERPVPELLPVYVRLAEEGEVTSVALILAIQGMAGFQEPIAAQTIRDTLSRLRAEELRMISNPDSVDPQKLSSVQHIIGVYETGLKSILQGETSKSELRADGQNSPYLDASAREKFKRVLITGKKSFLFSRSILNLGLLLNELPALFPNAVFETDVPLFQAMDLGDRFVRREGLDAEIAQGLSRLRDENIRPEEILILDINGLLLMNVEGSAPYVDEIGYAQNFEYPVLQMTLERIGFYKGMEMLFEEHFEHGGNRHLGLLQVQNGIFQKLGINLEHEQLYVLNQTAFSGELKSRIAELHDQTFSGIAEKPLIFINLLPGQSGWRHEPADWQKWIIQLAQSQDAYFVINGGPPAWADAESLNGQEIRDFYQALAAGLQERGLEQKLLPLSQFDLLDSLAMIEVVRRSGGFGLIEHSGLRHAYDFMAAPMIVPSVPNEWKWLGEFKRPNAAVLESYDWDIPAALAAIKSEQRVTMQSSEEEVAAWLETLAAEITDEDDRKAAESFVAVFKQNPELDRREISYEGIHQLFGVSRDQTGTSYAYILLDAAVHFPRELIRAALVHEGRHLLNTRLQDAQFAAFSEAWREWKPVMIETQEELMKIFQPLIDAVALTLEDEWLAYQAGDRVFLAGLDGSMDDFIRTLPEPEAQASTIEKNRYQLVRRLLEDILIRSEQPDAYEHRTKTAALQGILSVDKLLELNLEDRAKWINLFLSTFHHLTSGRYTAYDESQPHLNQYRVTDYEGIVRLLMNEGRYRQQLDLIIDHYTKPELRAYLSNSDFVTHEAIEESGYGQELRRKFTSAFDRIMAASVPAASQDLHTGIKAVLYTAYDKAPQIFLSIDPQMEARAAHVIYLVSERQLILKFPSVEKAREADENFLIGAILYATGATRTGHPWNIWPVNPRIRDNTYNIPAADVTYRVTSDLLNSLQREIVRNPPPATSPAVPARRRVQFRRLAPDERVAVPPRQVSRSVPASVRPRESFDEIEEIRFVNFRGNEVWQENAERVIRQAFRAIARTPTESLSDQRLQGVLKFIHQMMGIRGTSSHVVLAVEPSLSGAADEVASLGRLPAFFRIMLDRDGRNNGQQLFNRGARGNLFDQKVFIMHLRKWQVLAAADGTPANDIQIYDGVNIRDHIHTRPDEQIVRFDRDFLVKAMVHVLLDQIHSYPWIMAEKYPQIQFSRHTNAIVLPGTRQVFVPTPREIGQVVEHIIQFANLHSELRIAPPADASVPPSAANDAASARVPATDVQAPPSADSDSASGRAPAKQTTAGTAESVYSRVTAPESRATSDERRRIEVNYELFDTDAEGTITMPVSAFAEIAQQTVSADEDLKTEALAKMDALAVAAHRWRNVQVILYNEGTEYDDRTNYYLEQFRQLGNVTITPQPLEEALSVPRGKEHHTPVDISPEGRIEDHEYVGGELVKKLKFVKLRKNPGDILLGLLASITGGDLPGVVTGEDGNLDDLTGYATSQAQAYLARQVVAWAA